MADIVDKQTRSRMMSGIRSKDTKPELMVRKGLHQLGFRFRLHDPKLPGKPDLVFPKYHAVVFVHGCFWHGHDCPLFRWPSTRPDFWRKKINRNRERDADVTDVLNDAGWRTLNIWECALKGAGRLSAEELLSIAAVWLKGMQSSFEIRGKV